MFVSEKRPQGASSARLSRLCRGTYSPVLHARTRQSERLVDRRLSDRSIFVVSKSHFAEDDLASLQRLRCNPHGRNPSTISPAELSKNRDTTESNLYQIERIHGRPSLAKIKTRLNRRIESVPDRADPWPAELSENQDTTESNLYQIEHIHGPLVSQRKPAEEKVDPAAL